MKSARRAVLRRLLTAIREVRPGHRAIVAVDGLDGAGKTVLAEELVRLAAEGACARSVASVSIDGFHHPRAVRYAAGRGPESFYRDSYDYAAFERVVVAPFRRGAVITPAVWDVDADQPVSPEVLDLPEDCVLLVDGIFLHRPELREIWDASIWVKVPFEVSVPRGNQRFPHLGDSDPESEASHRYVGGQRLYFAEAAPWERATWVIDNTNLDAPSLSPDLDWPHEH
ncbi:MULTISPECIES: uridine kinase [unclassified Brevibacterium]|uniref:uridine kinase n=1 Tax=unclassified Brevibacterium TaxID=2614124 RepID=UPI001E50BEE2|nr:MULTISPECIES: uridine kinase [unclassified Brevibacterium]MCD1287458.1 uridine kinase [Brevibacterium sp. CCUG 69071]MDK8436744.1 uridine kinase [Brevibacterium sp. H-BE7]